jgi:hypothetical protein
MQVIYYMELHYMPEEAKKQIALPSTPLAYNHAVILRDREESDVVAEPQAVSELLAIAKKENLQRRRWAPISALWLVVQAAIIIAAPHSPVAGYSYSFSIVLGVLIARSFAIRYRRTTASLSAVDDLRMVGPLIDRLGSRSKDRQTRGVLKQALMRLLPRLKASNASLLTAGQKARLTRHLGHLAMFQGDKAFQVVILRALEQVGDAQSIPVVERIVRRQPRWSAQEEVHTAAMECLPFLLQRAEEDSSRQTLLRSASCAVGDYSQLLHPAEGVSGVDPGELLRAGAHGEDSPIGQPRSLPLS